MQITDEMIERGARVLLAREARWLPPSWVEFTDWEAIGERAPSWVEFTDWEAIGERARQKYREAARRCLEAALGGEQSAGE